MTFSTPVNIRFCVVEGQPLFLDLRRSSYFALKDHLRHAFLLLLSGETASAQEIDTLVSRGIVKRGSAEQWALAPPSIRIPTTSALEEGHTERKVGLGSFAAMASSQFGAELSLRCRSLGEIVRRLELRKRKAGRSTVDADLTADWAREFQSARRWLPIRPRCLPDSLALMGFLARRQSFPTLVLGVRMSPFGAHSWVQTDRRILSDAADNAATYTPILVV